jgi:hypothetical protein
MVRPTLMLSRVLLLTLTSLFFASDASATTAIALRSRHRVVLAADSRAIYGANRNATECKLFQYRNAYATVAGLAHYGTDFRASDAILNGYARPGSFQNHVSATAYSLEQRVRNLLSTLQRNNPDEYQRLMQRTAAQSDFVALALAEMVGSDPMLGVIELQRVAGQQNLAVKVTICPGNCRQGEGIFYLGYWEQIRPYVANSGRERSIGSAASIDRLIRLEIKAHPAEVGLPINILELGGSGPRWLQNGGNCSLPGVGW